MSSKPIIPVEPFEWFDEDGAKKGEPGQTFVQYENSLVFACPGCGKFGSIAIGNQKPPSPGWKIESGSKEDVKSLTLSPSIHCVGCCGWHGYLKNGVFESC